MRETPRRSEEKCCTLDEQLRNSASVNLDLWQDDRLLGVAEFLEGGFQRIDHRRWTAEKDACIRVW